MEYDDEENRLGGGIITLSVLHFIMSFLSIVGAIVLLTAGSSSEFQEALGSLAADLSTGTIIFEDIILRIVLIISLILILRKNKIGVYGYFLFAIVSLIFTIVTSGFHIASIIVSLIFPILMAIFIAKKKAVFGFT